VVVLVAEHLLRDPGALEIEADVFLVSHADAAEHLDGLVADEPEGLRHLCLGQARRQRAIIGIRIHRPQGVQYHRRSQFDLAKQLRRAVLQRLEAADPGAELLALLQVIQGAIEGGLQRTQHFRGERNVAPVQYRGEQIMALVEILMHLAPYGVFALLARLFATLGFGAIVDLGAYFLTVLAVLLIHALLVYSLILRVLTGLSPKTLLSKLRPVWAFAFSTASSGATLPVTMRTVERKLGVHNTVAGFTIPLGATVNMDGTAIMQGVATVFIAQVYGVDLSMAAYLTVILTATLASIGTAAVPGAGLITLAMVLTQVGLPVEGVALIIGVDRLLDMVRTAVNVTGDVVVSLIVADSEGQLDRVVYDAIHADNGDQDTVAAGAGPPGG